MSLSNRLILVAAGRGKRLGVETDAIPKCMVPVAGRPIFHRALAAMEHIGVTDFVIVRGYLGDRIDGAGRTLRFVENTAWADNNILASLMYARAEMASGFFFSYSDIVFAPDVARTLAEAARAHPLADGVFVVDRRFADIYEGRTEHPLTEAELTHVVGNRIVRVGKRVVPASEAAGEFIGLAYFSPSGAVRLQQIWDRQMAAHGSEAPFGTAPRLRQAYVSDALNAMADEGAHLVPAFIDGRWREIDTGQDLARASATVESWT